MDKQINPAEMKASKELKIGIFVIVVLAVSFVIINFLREKDLFNRQMEISSVYQDVQGLTLSAPVYIKGYKAGSVTDIAYDGESGNFTVTCSVAKGFMLPDDSRMDIFSVDIMGGKGIDIVPGSSSAHLSDGDMIAGAVRTDMLASLQESLPQLILKLDSLADSLGTVAGNINAVLDEETRAGISGSVRHLEDILEDIDRIASAAGSRSDDIVEFLDNLAYVSSRLVSVTDKADAAMSGIGGTAAALDSADIAGMVASVRELAEAIASPEGTVGRLLSDDGVYESVGSLVSRLDSLVMKIEENPRKYVRISLF